MILMLPVKIKYSPFKMGVGMRNEEKPYVMVLFTVESFVCDVAVKYNDTPDTG